MKNFKWVSAWISSRMCILQICVYLSANKLMLHSVLLCISTCTSGVYYFMMQLLCINLLCDRMWWYDMCVCVCGNEDENSAHLSGVPRAFLLNFDGVFLKVLVLIQFQFACVKAAWGFAFLMSQAAVLKEKHLSKTLNNNIFQKLRTKQ